MTTKQIIIDTDTHVTEPVDVWSPRMSSAKWGDLIPTVAWSDEMGCDAWFVAGEPFFPSWVTAVRGLAPGLAEGPKRLEEVHPSCYDAAARLEGMDKSGIAMEVLYPNIGLTGNPVPKQSPELSFELLRVRNDWLLDWISVDSRRFVPLACIPYWDVDEAVREIDRCAEAGHKGIVTTGAPQAHGLPALASPVWEPLWAAAEANRLPVSFHIASGDPLAAWDEAHLAVEGPATANARGSCWTFIDNAKFIVDLIFSGVLARHPDLNFVSVESGIGWIPYAMEAVDHMYKKGQVWTEKPEIDMLPSEYFRRQVYANYWFEKLTDHHLEYIGVDHILFETDFPHPCCLMDGEIGEAVAHGLDEQPDTVRERILWKNAAELYALSDLPFSTTS